MAYISKRCKWERKKYNAVHHKRLSAEPTEDDPLIWRCTIRGERDTPYDGGVFVLHLRLPADYPFKPPKMEWLTKIYHPNFKEGQTKFCIDILNDQWSPALSIWQTLLSVTALLDIKDDFIPSMCCGKPVTADSVDGSGCKASGLQEAVKLYFEDKPKFEAKAKQWTQRYAIFNLVICAYLRDGGNVSAVMPIDDIARIVSQYYEGMY